MGVFCRGGWQPMVCRSEMTCGLISLAAAHLSATSESRETLKEINKTPASRNRYQYAVSSHPIPSRRFLVSRSFVEGR